MWFTEYTNYHGVLEAPTSSIMFPIGSAPWPHQPPVPDFASDPNSFYSEEKDGITEHWTAYTSVENEQLVWEYLGYEFIEDWEDEDE